MFPLRENVPWGLYGGHLEFRLKIHKRVVNILTFDLHVTERCVTPIFKYFGHAKTFGNTFFNI